eukprot:2324340-Rhodomonas_salina.5
MYLRVTDHVFRVGGGQVVPFPQFEAQARFVAKVWSGRLDLPSEVRVATPAPEQHPQAATRN